MNKKILLICNESNTVLNFRKELISFLKNEGDFVYVICADDTHKKEINELDVECFYAPLKNRSINLFSFYKSKKVIKEIIKKIKPDIVFTFQLKPNIIGTFSAESEGCRNIFSMVEGMGDPFSLKGFKWFFIRKIVCFLYRKAFKKVKKVFVLNADDRKTLLKYKIVGINKIVLINGIGIDTKRYLPSFKISDKKNVVMLSRLIKTKGIIDFCKIAKIVREKRPDIYFELYGNESQLTKKDLNEYILQNDIFYGGYCENVKKIYENSRIVVSTSFYGEGFPRTILEAMAFGKPIIATNNVGSKDAVTDGETGFLLEKHDIIGFSEKIIEIIDDEKTLLKLGMQARKKCEDQYDSSIINNIIYTVISKDLYFD